MLLFFSAVIVLLQNLCDIALTESIEAGILMSTFDDAEDLVVNVSSTVDLLCVAYGTTSAPSVEWTSTTNGRIAVITNNSTNNQRYTICEQKKYPFTESILRIEDISLEDEGLYSCATRRNNGEISASSANKNVTIIVVGNENNDEAIDSKKVGSAEVGGATAGGILALLALLVVFVILWYCGQQQRKKYNSRLLIRNKELLDQFILSNNRAPEMETAIVAANYVQGASRASADANIKRLLVHKTDIQLMDIIGEGEYNQVYQAKLRKAVEKTHYIQQTMMVAVKTPKKNSFTEEDTQMLIRECVMMQKFDHPNIISIIGLCLNAGPSPYIILPFMENGSLLSYVQNNRAILCTNANADEETVCIARKSLMDMCLQIAKGMEYLAKMKIIHRDIAARNCMIDEHWVIKVADFGLTEALTVSEVYRELKNGDGTAKLPVKWMAPESLLEGIFSEKSDVWSYGVTCWEIFTTGTVPYPGVHPTTLARELSNGLRLYKPDNTACSDQMYELMNSCWEMDPKLRPGFSQMVLSIGKDLQSMTDYLYVSAFNKLNEQVTEKE